MSSDLVFLAIDAEKRKGKSQLKKCSLDDRLAMTCFISMVYISGLLEKYLPRGGRKEEKAAAQLSACLERKQEIRVNCDQGLRGINRA